MATGEGKYDEACTRMMKELDAQCVVLCVLSGKHGNGFSVTSETPHHVLALPTVFRGIADQIDQDIRCMEEANGRRNNEDRRKTQKEEGETETE